jgi:hypothetical protein
MCSSDMNRVYNVNACIIMQILNSRQLFVSNRRKGLGGSIGMDGAPIGWFAVPTRATLPDNVDRSLQLQVSRGTSVDLLHVDWSQLRELGRNSFRTAN